MCMTLEFAPKLHASTASVIELLITVEGSQFFAQMLNADANFAQHYKKKMSFEVLRFTVRSLKWHDTINYGN